MVTSRRRGCRACGGRLGTPDGFYCRDHWFELLDILQEKVEKLDHRANDIYIGRTCDPYARREEHAEDSGRSRLEVLHGSDDVDEIMAVEEALIRRCEHLDLSNETDESLGGVNPNRRNYVYVSWRPRRRRWRW